MIKEVFSIGEFREWAKDHKATAQTEIRASFDVEVRAASNGARALDFIVSTASVDRMGDTIAVNGWKLDNYRKNNPVLWAHDAGMPPIAKGVNVRIDGGKLKARAEFVPADNPAIGDFAEGIYQLYRGGFLSAVSVGFRPIKYEMSKDPARNFGFDFKEQELLEFSCVPIPALPDALVQARAAGAKVDSVFDWARTILRTHTAKEGASMDTFTRKAAVRVNELLVESGRAPTTSPSGSRLTDAEQRHWTVTQRQRQQTRQVLDDPRYLRLRMAPYEERLAALRRR